jgi:ribonuclease P protein component
MNQSAPPTPRPGLAEGFPRRLRIAARRDFTATYDAGRKLHGRLVVVFARPAQGEGRLGITATRKVGGAVVRNRARRRVREVYRRWRAAGPAGAAGVEVVVNVTARAARAPYGTLRDELVALLDRAARAAWPERA